MGTFFLIIYFSIAGILGSIVMRILSGGYPQLSDDQEKKEFLEMSTGKKIFVSILAGALWPALIGLGLLMYYAKKE